MWQNYSHFLVNGMLVLSNATMEQSNVRKKKKKKGNNQMWQKNSHM